MTAIFRTAFEGAALSLGATEAAALWLAATDAAADVAGLGVAPLLQAAMIRLMVARPAVQNASREWVADLRIRSPPR
ncbi:MAG: hypothetical protein WKF78_00220 [Candidatus Limnocylindrales bacterium]